MLVWARPFDDRSLVSDGFANKKSKRAYQGTYVEAKTKGATLVKRIRKAKKVALVVGTGKGFGSVRVFLGDKRLRTLDLGTDKTRFRTIVLVKTFKKPQSGRLTIRTLSGKKVRIDGLGVLKR